jgi:Secretion system C-terminal sorting domain
LGNNPSKLYSKAISNLLYNSIDSLAFQLDSSANFNGSEPTWFIIGNKYEYDSKNRLIKHGLTLDPNEKNIPPYYEYIHQSNNGKEIKITNFYYQGQVINSDTLIKNTNTIGLKIESISKYGGSSILQYNTLGQLIEKADTSIYKISNTKYGYNSKGLLINEKVFYDDTISGYAHVAKVDYQVNYKYDDKNRLMNYNSKGWFISNNNHPKLKYFFQTNVDYITNLEKESVSDDVLIFPNPASTKIQITNALNIECMQSISINNTLGEQLIYKNFPNKEYIFEPGEAYTPNTNGTCTQIIHLPDLPNGMYFVNIKTGTNKLITKKLMIAK